MIVVSDSTPLITLMKAMHLDLLYQLFGEIQIPNAVYKELTTNNAYKDEADLIKESSYINIVSVLDQRAVSFLQRATGLDRGESEAIIYADEIKADLLLMDEEKGRRVAQNMNLPIAGSMGVLIRAYQDGLLNSSEVEEAVVRIKESNRHISERLFQRVLQVIHQSR